MTSFVTESDNDMITCSKGCKWSGLSRAHCGSCHTTFGGVTSFDRHRRGGMCVKPEDIGLIAKDNGEFVIWVGEFVMRGGVEGMNTGVE